MVMLFGLTNTLATFQQVMDEMMGLSKGEWSWVHMDDLLVYSTTFNEHLKHLKETFRQIHKQELYVKLTKCEFARAKMEYLGHIIGNDGIQTDPKKIESVRKVRPLKNQKELQSFLGLALYYWCFICSFSHIASPLSKLTSKQVKWKWTADKQNAFVALKEALVSAPVLWYPDVM